NLPFHVFSQKNKNNNNNSNQPTASTQKSNNLQANSKVAIPAGFDQYKDSTVPFVFDYPKIWGMPAATTEPGYTKRGGTNKPDGTHAVLIGFATNKDVEVVATSGKYLPPARTPLFYDYSQWCIKPNDSKKYNSVLDFTTTNGVDTISTTQT